LSDDSSLSKKTLIIGNGWQSHQHSQFRWLCEADRDVPRSFERIALLDAYRGKTSPGSSSKDLAIEVAIVA